MFIPFTNCNVYCPKLPIVMLAVQKDHYNMLAQNEQLQCLLPKMTNFDRLSQKTIKMCIAQKDQ